MGDLDTAGLTLKSDFQRWAAAWQDLPNNPLARYFALAEKRRLAAIPGWRRRLPYVVITVLVSSPAVIVLLAAGYDWWLGVGDFEDFITATVIAVLVGISAAYAAYLLGTVYNTALAVMSAMAQPGLRLRGQVLDDMAAVTLLNDREVVVALVRIHWPRLVLTSVLGAAVFWVWLLSAHLDFFTRALRSYDDLTALYLIVLSAPLTVAAITICGALAGLILILALIAFGNGLLRGYAASMTGFSAAAANLVFVAASAPMAIMLGVEGSRGYGGIGELPWDTALIAALTFAVGLTLMVLLLLLLAERWRGGRAFIAPGVPLLAFAGYALLGFFLYVGSTFNYNLDYLIVETVMACYPLSWGALPLVNCSALPSTICLGVWPDEWSGYTPFEWFRYPLLLLQQLALVLIALHFARRAVRQRRQSAA